MLQRRCILILSVIGARISELVISLHVLELTSAQSGYRLEFNFKYVIRRLLREGAETVGLGALCKDA